MTEILDRLEEAADEIKRLRNDTQMLWDAVAEKNAEIKRLRAALEEMVRWMPSGFAPQSKALAMEMARAALSCAVSVPEPSKEADK